MNDPRQLFRELLIVIAALLVGAAICHTARAADLREEYQSHEYHDQMPHVFVPPMVIAPPVPTCSYERETEYDDVLGTDSTEREICQ